MMYWSEEQYSMATGDYGTNSYDRNTGDEVSMSFEKMAEILGGTPDSLRCTAARALRKLRNTLDKERAREFLEGDSFRMERANKNTYDAATLPPADYLWDF